MTPAMKKKGERAKDNVGGKGGLGARREEKSWKKELPGVKRKPPAIFPAPVELSSFEFFFFFPDFSN